MMKTQLESLVEEMIDGSIRLEDALAEFEKCFILKALERHQGHLSHTAAFLGIHRNTLSSRLKTYKTGRIIARRREPPKRAKRARAAHLAR